jgi:hypothetical protein
MRLALVAFVLALAACGGPAPAPSVCDGGAGARLVLRYDLPGPFAPGEHVLYDNGATFLFVGGQCTYHVKTGGRWEDVQRGDTDDATLVDALELEELPARAGGYTGDLDGAPTMHLAFAGDVVDCAAGCMGGDVPDDIAQLAARGANLLSALDTQGFTQSISQRILVVAEAVPPTPAFTWPLAADPSALAVSATDAETAPATLVTGADADLLRALRRDVRDAQFPPAAAYITTDATMPPIYAAFLRDALPFEDADGIVPDP